MRPRPDFAAMSDPTRNRWFSRRWTAPPGKRRGAPAQGASGNQESNLNATDHTHSGAAAQQARIGSRR